MKTIKYTLMAIMGILIWIAVNAVYDGIMHNGIVTQGIVIENAYEEISSTATHYMPDGRMYETKSRLMVERTDINGIKTTGMYNGIIVYEHFDPVSDNIDSIKCARYLEAMSAVETYERIDKLECK